MAGHSKWANIKHRKGAQDAKRGKVFTRVIKEITVAARSGGGDPASNPRLRSALANARSVNVSKDTVEKAIKRGTGEIEGAQYEEVTYEGYGPGGVAVIVEALTDNRNRTTPEVRHAFSKCGGNMGESNSVAWMFGRKGIIAMGEGVDEETLMEVALEAGASDVLEEDGTFRVVTEPADLETVREAIEAAGLSIEEAKAEMVPDNTVEISGKQADQVLRLLDMLEENDDVQNVYANFDLSDEEMERLGG
ncbi:MAG: YebC/PmpR family DNA-binding transcriptional regulator [Alphaproteobacteria bacterium CG_4_10_14_0_2_um_filter_63_37]|nr:MAG: transcriptional regulator [Proteobacteria bacterium CG1_02_64_396]PJA23515.1 MAG: YebC/PmpR family DNA-binding transcriptional regulator [Alphaproteobacteria bacterium CG_4_10_14_0_2_um_filter_63_37]